MKESQYQWKEVADKDSSESELKLLSSYNIPKIFETYTANLGLKTEEDFRKFFQPNLEDLYDPYLFYDMEKAIQRIQEAIENQEKILIYGDYDADGITSTTILKETIENIGGLVYYYLPNRFKDGYGPNIRVYKEFIEFGVSLIITVDNGVSGHEAIAYGNSQGVDVIVTDHHELPATLPDAFAIIHPRHPRGNYPFGQLAGAGVSFKVACALLGEIPVDLLELVALGTVADLVPLKDENRVLVQLGLQQMKYTERVGLSSLFKEAGVSFEEITEETIGFQIAPRLNALGRMDEASMGVELLTTFHEEEAEDLSKTINEINEKRKGLVEKDTALAFEKLEDDPISFVADASFHEGIIGIVAGKLKQARNRPAFVLTINEETKIAKGSARSIEAFNLFKNLQKISTLFETFGGHQMAAGFTLKTENLNVFKEKVMELFNEETAGKDLREVHTADFILASTQEVNYELIDGLNRFAPFGTKHPKPHFLVENVTIGDLKKLGANQNHLKFLAQKNGPEITTIAFQKGSELEELSSGGEISLLVDLAINSWNGHRQIQFQLIDYRVKGLQLFDGRKKDFNNYLNKENYYLVWDQRMVKRYHLPKERVIFYDSKNVHSPMETVVMVDCPSNLQKLRELVRNQQITRLVIVAKSQNQAFLNGIPSREVFGNVYKFLRKQKNLDVRFKSTEIANFLNLSKEWFIFIVEVFLEMNFVKIEDGLLNPVENPKTQEIEKTKVYKNWQKEMKAEEFLLYSSLNDVSKWLGEMEES